MATSTLESLAACGQSIWLDNINRSLLRTGKLKSLIDIGLRGLTSNPSIFDAAISKSTVYDAIIEQLCVQGKPAFEIYDDVTSTDIQEAADAFLPVYERTHGQDGYVSLEINPLLAFNIEESIQEGRRLFAKVNRPNLMLKVPATDEGFQITEELLANGINVNVTLIFSVQQYRATARAYMNAIQRLLERNEDIRQLHSVASVFVSRIDTVVDTTLESMSSQEVNSKTKQRIHSFKGQAAIANAAMIYKVYVEIFSGGGFELLAEKGANKQRVLWGSTSTKNPAYSDIKYVAELIGRNTVNTIPENTLSAFLDHGEVKESLTADIRKAQRLLRELLAFGIDIDAICKQLLCDGVTAFEKSFHSLLLAIEKKSERAACSRR